MFKYFIKLLNCAFYHKMIGAIKAGAMYANKDCDGTYYLTVYDDKFKSEFVIKYKFKSLSDLIDYANSLNYNYPN